MASNGFIELLRLSDRARRRQEGGDTQSSSMWSGIAFRIGNYNLIAPLGEISEVLSLPEVTVIPLVKPWMLGIANVRGRLLPITDMSQFLQISAQGMRLDQKKVLVIDESEMFSGLVVDQVYGIQHFSHQHYESQSNLYQTTLGQYVHGSFNREGTAWHIFLPSRLVKDQQFFDVAI